MAKKPEPGGVQGLKGNLVLAQSGGPTAVINASVAGAIKQAKKLGHIKSVFGAVNGILGVLNEEMINLGRETAATVELLKSTPSSALGSCRYKLSEQDFETIFRVFEAHDIRYFVIAGGNDSMDTAHKVATMGRKLGYELNCMGIPKTIDNDLGYTDHCPGYGSVARWLATSVRDAGLDTEAICTADTVKIIETMGRNAGWITAATAMARTWEDAAPHLIYLPERPLVKSEFLADVDRVYNRLGRVVICVCEGLKDEKGGYLSASGSKVDVDGFGHKQLGGVSDVLCNMIASELGIKARFDKPGTIQRMGAALASPVDVKEAEMVGARAVELAAGGFSGYMVTLERKSNKPYRCAAGLARLDKVANAERPVPQSYINKAGNDVSKRFIDYVTPLMGGPLPRYARLKKVFIEKKLPGSGPGCGCPSQAPR